MSRDAVILALLVLNTVMAVTNIVLAIPRTRLAWKKLRHWEEESSAEADGYTDPGYTDVVFTREDKSQVLVTHWADGSWSMAERKDSDGSSVWGVPIDGKEEA